MQTHILWNFLKPLREQKIQSFATQAFVLPIKNEHLV